MIKEDLTLIDKLLFSLNENNEFKYDNDFIHSAFEGIGRAYMKKWMGNVVPYDFMKDSIKESINKTVNLSEGGIFYKKFPKNMHSPNYGDKWEGLQII